MPRTRPPYPEEFRRQMVELVRAGRTPEELAREFEPSAQTIRNWAAQFERSALPTQSVGPCVWARRPRSKLSGEGSEGRWRA